MLEAFLDSKHRAPFTVKRILTRQAGKLPHNTIPVKSDILYMRRHANIIGQNVVKLRYKKDWTQDQLAAKMQLSGYYITRQIIANIETRRSSVRDKRIACFAEIFDVKVGDLFPQKAVLKTPTVCK